MPKGAQMFGDLFCGTHSPVAEFRVRMEVAPPLDGFRLDGLRGGVELGARDCAGGRVSRGRSGDDRQEKSGQGAAHYDGPS